MKEASIKTWVRQWIETGRLLAELKQKEFEQADHSAIFLSLTDASESALMSYPPKPSSGMIEMQRLFRKLKKK